MGNAWSFRFFDSSSVQRNVQMTNSSNRKTIAKHRLAYCNKYTCAYSVIPLCTESILSKIHHYFTVFHCLQSKSEQISLPTGKIRATVSGAWSMCYL